jgi:hypothetical protein
LTALLAPVLLSLLGLGAVTLLPDVHLAAPALPQISLRPPGVSNQGPAPLATPGIDQIVPPGRVEVRVPILEYHYVRVNADPRDRLGFNLSVTPPDFGAQMDWLQNSGFHPIDLNDRPNYMAVDQVQVIDQSGVEVAAHTMHHVNLTRSSPAGLVLEVQGSRNALEQIVGHPVLDFCYPSGQYNATVIAATQQAGFQSATTELPGTRHTWANRLVWSRVRVNGGEKLEQFASSLEQPEPTISAPPV